MVTAELPLTEALPSDEKPDTDEACEADSARKPGKHSRSKKALTYDRAEAFLLYTGAVA